MPVVFTTLIVIVAIVVIVAFIVYAVRSSRRKVERTADTSPVSTRPTPTVSEFHVSGDTASTVFAVPLGDAEPGQHLIDLLSASAVEYVRQKTADGLPLDGIRRIEVSAMRGDVDEKLCTVDLPEPGVLPEVDEKILVELTGDPIAAVQDVVADTSVSTRATGASTLETVGEFISLSGPTEAHLRSIGVDTDAMNLEDLVLGLLRVSGYEVHVGRSGVSGTAGGSTEVYNLTRSGQSTLLMIFGHDEDSHPELADSVLAGFAVAVAQSNPDQAILVTDKYSPYSMYEREKRDKRLVFITRERLQAFVDSFGLT